MEAAPDAPGREPRPWQPRVRLLRPAAQLHAPQWSKAIRVGQERGEIRPDADPDLVATEILAFLQGMELHNNHGAPDISLVEVCEDFARRMIRDLAVDPDVAQPDKPD